VFFIHGSPIPRRLSVGEACCPRIVRRQHIFPVLVKRELILLSTKSSSEFPGIESTSKTLFPADSCLDAQSANQGDGQNLATKYGTVVVLFFVEKGIFQENVVK
jgi:hypothetical protein